MRLFGGSAKFDWKDLKAPELDDFETMAAEAYAALPADFRAMTGEIEIRVADFPDEEVVKEMELESDFDILGLFHGTGPRTRRCRAGNRPPSQPGLALSPPHPRLLGRA